MNWIKELLKDRSISEIGMLLMLAGAFVLAMALIIAAFVNGGFVGGIVAIALTSIVFGFLFFIGGS